jgi:transmembrane 9 superfamily protein 3
MMVVFLCGLVALILMRTLKADYARYMREELLEDGEAGGVLDKGMGDESGWKQVHGDVFRRPPRLELLSALTGAGTQLLLLAALVIAAALAGSLYVDRGAITKAVIVGYALTSAVAGFVSGRSYRAQFFPEPSPNWIRVMLLTASLFPAAVFGVIVALNLVAMGYGTSNVLSFWTLAKVVVIWAFVSLPLVIGGTILGRRFTSKPHVPTRINAVPRPTPARPWYASSTMVVLLAGILPFGSIFIETYFVFTSFWNYKFYYV